MNALRVLLIEKDPETSDRLTNLLEASDHTVLALNRFDEAAEALEIQRFDAVLTPVGMADAQLIDFVRRLRELERAGRSATRVPVIAYGIEGTAPGREQDATLSDAFTADEMTLTVARLASTISPAAAGTPADEGSDLPVFQAAEFQEQMGFDQELVIEIIDIFLGECGHQLTAMQESLVSGNFVQLSHVAHTIKGSFGSLYASRAAAHAQKLELAAKKSDREACTQVLALVENDLDVLKPELLALRNS